MADKIKFKKPIELEEGVTINGTTIPTNTKLVSNLEDSETEGALIQKKRAEEFTGSLDNQLYTVGANGKYSIVFGGKGYTGADAKYSMVFGTGNIAKSGCTFMIGDNCLSEPTSDKSSESFNSFVTGYSNHVVGSAYSVTAGRNNTLIESPLSFVVGSENEVHGINAFVEGCQNFNGELIDIPTPEPGPIPEPDPYTATRGEGSHVSGIGNKNDSYYSFVTGSNNVNAGANYSFLTGYSNSAKDQAFTFTVGLFNENSKLPGKAVFGRYNKDIDNALFEVGTGTEELRQSDFYIDINGQTHASNLVASQLSVTGGTIEGEIQKAEFANKVKINPDSAYIGSLLVNNQANEDIIVRKDTINVTATGKLIVGAQTVEDDSDLTLVTKGYALAKSGDTMTGNLIVGDDDSKTTIYKDKIRISDRGAETNLDAYELSFGVPAAIVRNDGSLTLSSDAAPGTHEKIKIGDGIEVVSAHPDENLTYYTSYYAFGDKDNPAETEGSSSKPAVIATREWVTDNYVKNGNSSNDITVAAPQVSISGDHVELGNWHSLITSDIDNPLTIDIEYDDKQGYYVMPYNDGSSKTNRYTLATEEWIAQNYVQKGKLFRHDCRIDASNYVIIYSVSPTRRGRNEWIEHTTEIISAVYHHRESNGGWFNYSAFLGDCRDDVGGATDVWIHYINGGTFKTLSSSWTSANDSVAIIM